MRTLLAIVIILGALASSAAAEAEPKRTAKARDHAVQQRSSPRQQVVECERARHEDPTGSFGNYPCWAREAFARGSQGNRQ
jgi:hypothetical protein